MPLDYFAARKLSRESQQVFDARGISLYHFNEWKRGKESVKSKLAFYFTIVGIVMAITAHFAHRIFKRLAHERYQMIIRDREVKDPTGLWTEVRPIMGPWGCLVIFLELIRGFGILLTVGSALYGLMAT
jgi:hypothetical protein